MLDSAPVSRSLESKSTIFWLEIVDLFSLAVLCSTLNFLFGATSLRIPLVDVPTIVATVGLILAKRGKPDGYLKHFAHYSLTPNYLTCFALDNDISPFPVRAQSNRKSIR